MSYLATPLSLCAVLGFAVAGAACSHADAPPPGNMPASPAQPATAATTPPAPGTSTAIGPIDPALREALAGSVRTDAERARDPARHPAETLTFFGLKSDMHVVELWPGGGWYTAILGPYLRDRGQLTITTAGTGGDPNGEETKQAVAMAKRIADHPNELGKVALQTLASSPDKASFGPDGSADLVLTFRNVHNWIPGNIAPNVFAAAARVLKHGGVLGVVDHRAASDLTVKQIDDTGYVSEAQVIALAKAAGLELEARSEVNANPKDTKDYPHGVWSLPPTYSGGDVDRAKFAAIGESDRMTLRFRKP